MYNENSSPEVRECEFIGNEVDDCGGAVANDGTSSPTFVNCEFVDGVATYGGGVYEFGSSSSTFLNCKFTGNQGLNTGGGLYLEGQSTSTLTNCLFVDNSANRPEEGGVGGGIYLKEDSTVTATNCTISGNSCTGTEGGGVYLGINATSTSSFRNCILWGNVSDSDGDPMEDQKAQINRDPAVTYSDIQQCTSLCNDPDDHNIGVDPMFVVGPSDNWTEDGVYCDQACWDDELCTVCGEGQGGLEVGQSKFTTGATYTADEHVGKLLNPNTTQDRVALIAANTATTVTVWGDLTGVGGPGDLYQIDDYRLDSSAGSPCIDAADNNAVTICSADLDGKERFFDDLATDDTGNGVAPPFVDMGAYEFGSPPSPDCNANGTPDECDIAGGFSNDCDGNGIPEECEAPGPPITQQPVDTTVRVGNNASFDVSATGGQLEYQWRKNGVDLQDDARIMGSQTAGLDILEVIVGDAGAYDCVIEDLAAPNCITSDAATLTVLSNCLADFDNDGTVGASDLGILLGAWGPNPDHPADLNNDGAVGAFDLAILLGAWGTCQ